MQHCGSSDAIASLVLRSKDSKSKGKESELEVIF